MKISINDGTIRVRHEREVKDTFTTMHILPQGFQ